MCTAMASAAATRRRARASGARPAGASNPRAADRPAPPASSGSPGRGAWTCPARRSSGCVSVTRRCCPVAVHLLTVRSGRAAVSCSASSTQRFSRAARSAANGSRSIVPWIRRATCASTPRRASRSHAGPGSMGQAGRRSGPGRNRVIPPLERPGLIALNAPGGPPASPGSGDGHIPSRSRTSTGAEPGAAARPLAPRRHRPRVRRSQLQPLPARSACWPSHRPAPSAASSGRRPGPC